MHQSRLTPIRFIVVALFIAVFGHAACAQESKMLRVGKIGVQTPATFPTSVFLKRMAELGYVQGENFVFEFVRASSIEDYDRAYRELVTRKLDIILASARNNCNNASFKRPSAEMLEARAVVRDGNQEDRDQLYAAMRGWIPREMFFNELNIQRIKEETAHRQLSL